MSWCHPASTHLKWALASRQTSGSSRGVYTFKAEKYIAPAVCSKSPDRVRTRGAVRHWLRQALDNTGTGSEQHTWRLRTFASSGRSDVLSSMAMGTRKLFLRLHHGSSTVSGQGTWYRQKFLRNCGADCGHEQQENQPLGLRRHPRLPKEQTPGSVYMCMVWGSISMLGLIVDLGNVWLYPAQKVTSVSVQ